MWILEISLTIHQKLQNSGAFGFLSAPLISQTQTAVHFPPFNDGTITADERGIEENR